MIEKIIKNVLELPGVDGACILDKKGNLLHNALPDFFLDVFLDDLSRRVTALYEAVDENYVPCDDYLLKYPQKYIQLRRSRQVYLLVIVDPTVNLVSLRMVTNLVLKHITPKTLSSLRNSTGTEENSQPKESAPEAVAPQQEVKTETPVEATVETKVETKAEEPEAPRPAPRPRPALSYRGTQY